MNSRRLSNTFSLSVHLKSKTHIYSRKWQSRPFLFAKTATAKISVAFQKWYHRLSIEIQQYAFVFCKKFLLQLAFVCFNWYTTLLGEFSDWNERGKFYIFPFKIYGIAVEDVHNSDFFPGYWKKWAVNEKQCTQGGWVTFTT